MFRRVDFVVKIMGIVIGVVVVDCRMKVEIEMKIERLMEIGRRYTVKENMKKKKKLRNCE